MSYENGRQFYINEKFLLPGKNFFNEKVADKTIEIPEKKVKLQKVKDKVLNTLFDNPMDGEVEPLALNLPDDTPTEEDDSW